MDGIRLDKAKWRVFLCVLLQNTCNYLLSLPKTVLIYGKNMKLVDMVMLRKMIIR